MEFFNRIHCKYTGIKGFITVYNDAIRYRYMITQKAQEKARILVFWEKHGLQATLDAFPVKRSTLYAWKKQWEEGGEKIEPLLSAFCKEHGLQAPKSRTIGNLIHDLGGLRTFPKKVSHFGKVKIANRQKVLRKPKDFRPEYPGHLIALDTVERFVNGCRRYVITFEDVYTRFSFAWGTKSHASLAAAEFFALCQRAFPHSYNFLYVLTDNGSEFEKHFAKELRRFHLTHFHTYPKTPKMNAHLERFNRTIQEEFVDYNSFLLKDPDSFNRKLMDYLIFYNTERVHGAFKNRLSPVQFMLQWSQENIVKIPVESRIGLHYTLA